VEDHHVDRPGVEARQRVKLTGTNSSFDLITLILRARHRRQRIRPTVVRAPETKRLGRLFRAGFVGPETRRLNRLFQAGSALRWSGGNCEGISTRSHSELGR
jgi:hypothetical protein